MNYYPFHIGDYASATRHLTWDEDMAYRRLIDAYYTREAPIPTDMRQVYRLVMATTEDQRLAVDTILNEFFTYTDDGWVNTRCDSEIEAFRIKSTKASQSAQSRWRNANGKQTDSERNANASLNVCERIETGCEGNAPKTNPKTNISKPKGLDSALPKKGTQLPDGFQPNDTGIRYAEARNIDTEVEFESFCNWHKAKGTLMKDWQAAWRTWCDKSQQFQAKGGKGASESFFERDQRSKADRISQFTGQAPRPAGNVIDVTPSAKMIGGAK